MHPVILEILAGYGQFDIDKTTKEVHLELALSRFSREVDTEICFIDHCDQETFTVEVRVKLRCSIEQGVRTKLFIKGLAKKMAPLNVQVVKYPPRTLALRGTLDSDSAEGTGSSLLELTELLLDEYIFILFSSAAILRLTHRLARRHGTNGYRKLLPSHLAELAVCGRVGEYSLH